PGAGWFLAKLAEAVPLWVTSGAKTRHSPPKIRRSSRAMQLAQPIPAFAGQPSACQLRPTAVNVRRMKTDTLLVHAGEPRPRLDGSVAMPIFQSSTFEETENRGYHDIRYARLSNTPSHDSLHQKLAALEGAEAALATASGMAAVSAALFSVLREGDHIIAQDGLYGGTHDLIRHDLPQLGIEHTFVPGDDPGAWERALTPRTRVFYVEAMTNPLVRVADLPAAASFARSHGLISIIDNT